MKGKKEVEKESKIGPKLKNFKCPKCSYNMVLPFRDFCPKCGIELQKLIEEKLSESYTRKRWNLEELLKRFLKDNSEVNGAIIVSTEGLVITSMLPEGIIEEKMVIMSSVLYSFCDKLLSDMWKGDLDGFYIKDSEGCLLITVVQPNALIIVSVTTDKGIEYIIFELIKLSRRITSLKKNFEFIKEINLKSNFGEIFKQLKTLLEGTDLVREANISNEFEKNSSNIKYESLLKRWVETNPGINGAILMSTKGFIMASDLPQTFNKRVVNFQSLELLTFAKRLLIMAGKNEFDHFYIRGIQGEILFFQVDPNAVLITLGTFDVSIRTLLYYSKHFCDRISRIDNNNDEGDDDNRFPRPYIFKPPYPPDDIAPIGQQQLMIPITKKKSEYKPYCKNCGSIISEGQSICHVCGKNVI